MKKVSAGSSGAPPVVDRWDAHWNGYAAATAMNPAQAYRRALVFDLLELGRSRSPVRVLDVGSGTGDFALAVIRARSDAEVVGIDSSDVGVSMATRKVPGANFFVQDLTRPPALEPKFVGWATHAVCSEVLEHLDDPAATLRNVKCLLAPGCRFAVTVPGGPMSAFDRRLGHRRHYTAALLAATLREGGFDVGEVRTAGFPFFNVYRLAVVARGDKLRGDIACESRAGVPGPTLRARAAMRAFSWLFRLNTSKTAFGWQLAAVASPSV